MAQSLAEAFASLDPSDPTALDQLRDDVAKGKVKVRRKGKEPKVQTDPDAKLSDEDTDENDAAKPTAGRGSSLSTIVSVCCLTSPRSTPVAPVRTRMTVSFGSSSGSFVIVTAICFDVSVGPNKTLPDRAS